MKIALFGTYIHNRNYLGWNLTDGHEYPIIKVLENRKGRRVVTIDDKGNMIDTPDFFFKYTTK